MKQKLSLLIVLATFYVSLVAGQPFPKDGFELLLPVTKLSIARGQTDSVEVSILRSRLYTGKRVALLRLASIAKKEMEVIIKEVPGRPDVWVLIISVSEAAEPGNYAIIPSCQLYSKVKGTVLTVTVN